MSSADYLMVEGGGFEPPKLARQIYSLIPLATREPLRKAAYCPDGHARCQPLLSIKLLTYESFVNGPTEPIRAAAGAGLERVAVGGRSGALKTYNKEGYLSATLPVAGATDQVVSGARSFLRVTTLRLSW